MIYVESDNECGVVNTYASSVRTAISTRLLVLGTYTSTPDFLKESVENSRRCISKVQFRDVCDAALSAAVNTGATLSLEYER